MTRRSSIALASSDGEFLLEVDEALPIYSLTKPFIASAIFEAGIDIQAPLSTWFGESDVPRSKDILVRHLLNHTSGLPDYGGLPEYKAAVASGEAPWPDAVFAQHTLQLPLLFEPEEGWSYSNPGYYLLSQILQNECDASLGDALDRLIIGPLGLRSATIAQGQFADDLPNYDAGWVWHGLLLSSASDVVKFMRSDFVKPLLENPYSVPFRDTYWKDPHYGYGVMSEPTMHYGHNGDGPGYSASCFHFPSSGLTGCVLTNEEGEGVAMKRLFDIVEDYSS